jgi:CRP-like cAMP-binding protein
LDPWLKRWEIEDPSALAGWIDGMRLLSVPQDRLIVEAGQHSRWIYLVQSGLVRLFYANAEGRERNKAFYGPGDITGPVSAIIRERPASFSIQALEPCELIQADLELLLHIAPHHPQVSRLMIRLLSDAFIRNEQREALLLTCNAEQRYRWLLKNQPELVGRIPQYHLAAYLGVDAVSLSRLKRSLDHGGDSGEEGSACP